MRHKPKNKTTKLWNNKKGSIPIVSELTNFVTGAVQWLTQSAPKPFLVIFFLLLILIGSVILTLTVRLFGYHCNSAGLPMTTGTLDIFTNINLIKDVPDPETLNLVQLETERLPIQLDSAGTCAKKFTNATYTLNGQTIQATNKWFYDGRFCTKCTTAEVTQYVIGGTNIANYCIGNVYPLPSTNKSFLQKNLCWLGCEPPINYYFDTTTGKYQCADLNLCGSNTVAKVWDQELAQSGATPLYPSGFTQTTDDTGVFSIQCNEKLEAQFTTFGIPIFNYQLWLIITVVLTIIAMFRWVMTHS